MAEKKSSKKSKAKTKAKAKASKKPARRKAAPKKAKARKAAKKSAGRTARTTGLDKSVEEFRASLERNVTLSRDRLQEVVDDAVKRGRMTRTDAEDLVQRLISLGRQYHLLRPLTSNDALFIYVALDRQRANLALARHHLAAAEKDLVV